MVARRHRQEDLPLNIHLHPFEPTPITFTKDEVRGNALKALGAIAHLSQKERRRVLLHALKLSDP